MPQYALWWTSGHLKLHLRHPGDQDSSYTLAVDPGSWLLFAIAENVALHLLEPDNHFWWIRFSTSLFHLRLQNEGPIRVLRSPSPGSTSARRLGAAVCRLVETRLQHQGSLPPVQRLETRAVFLKVLSRLIAELPACGGDATVVIPDEQRTAASGATEICSDMERTLNILHKRLGDSQLTLENLAQEVGYHPNYLSHKFKGVFGETPTALLQRQRLARAKELLGHSDLSITEISAAVGYHPNYFYRLFRSATGTTPGQYREHHRDQSLTSR